MLYEPTYITKEGKPLPSKGGFWERLLGYRPRYRPPPDPTRKAHEASVSNGRPSKLWQESHL